MKKENKQANKPLFKLKTGVKAGPGNGDGDDKDPPKKKDLH